jgi:hypothetical protein
VMTLRDIERWLTEYIVGVYHAKQHRGIQTSPLQRWTAGVIGDPESGGANPQRRPSDEQRFRLDFLPFVERTVQPYGVAIDGIRYYGDVLRRFIGASEDGRKRSFVFGVWGAVERKRHLSPAVGRIAQGPQLASGDGVGDGERIPAQDIDVVVDQG